MKNMRERKGMEEFMDEVLAKDFFTITCGLNEEERDSLALKQIMMESMLLLDRKNVTIVEGKDFDTAKRRNMLKSAFEYLEAAFVERENCVSVGELPVLVYMADAAQDLGIEPACFARWWKCLWERACREKCFYR